jgi:16S rRNA (guanine966-N2)-methyltransferase
MRIIAGELKGREIVPPRGSRLRPVTGMVRETAMNLYTPERLTAGPFLDLCAGSGLMGLEALSRGAPRAVFVEADGRTAGHLRRTLEQLGLGASAQVLKMDVRRCANAVRRCLDGVPASCVFLDPPYIDSMADELLAACGRFSGLIANDGLLIARAPAALPQEVPGLRHVSQRQAGRSCLGLYQPDPAAHPLSGEARNV